MHNQWLWTGIEQRCGVHWHSKRWGGRSDRAALIQLGISKDREQWNGVRRVGGWDSGTRWFNTHGRWKWDQRNRRRIGSVVRTWKCAQRRIGRRRIRRGNSDEQWICGRDVIKCWIVWGQRAAHL